MPNDGPTPNQDCKLYFTAQTGASPTWTEAERAKNANLGTSATTTGTDARDSAYSYDEVNNVKIGPLTFDYQIIAGGDTVYNTLRAAFTARTKLRFAQMDGDIGTAGSEGWAFWGQVTKCDVPEGEGDTRKASVEVAPTRHYEAGVLIEPEYIVVE